MIVFPHLDEDDLFVLGWSFENDLIVVIHREYDDLITSEMKLKGFDLGSTARSFGDSSSVVRFFGFFFLGRVTLFSNCRSRWVGYQSRSRLLW